MGKEMDKLIYIHIISMGKSLEKLNKDATNDWYVIKQTSDKGAQMTRVFEDISQVNHKGDALVGTGCEVIGSSIYVIGGRSVISEINDYRVEDIGSKDIRCLDTINPRDGWKTCYTLPFSRSQGTSAVVDGWLYLFAGDRHRCGCGPPDPWGYAVNLNAVDENDVKAKELPAPNNCTYPPVTSTSLSPDFLIVYMLDESTMYRFDCSQGHWTVYKRNLRHFPGAIFCSIATHDGILYTYDSSEMFLFSYDIANGKELPSIRLPNSPLYGPEEFIKLIVLNKDRFCIMWSWYVDVNEMHLFYTRFSVSRDPQNPEVIFEENQIFKFSGFGVLNIVTLDPHSDATTERLHCNNGVVDY